MKRYFVLFGILASMTPVLVSAADPLGPPKASLAPGQLGLGVEYSYAQLQLEKVRRNGQTLPLDIDDMHTAYLTLSVGVTEWLDLFLRVGGIDMEGSRSRDYRKGKGRYRDDYDYDYGTDVIYGGGARVTFGSIGNVTFGAVGSFSYAEFDGDYLKLMTRLNGPGSPDSQGVRGSLDAELQQISVGVGATWQLREYLSIYGGGLLHHVRLHQGIREDYVPGDTRASSSNERSTVFKNDDGGSMLGGYAGVQWSISEALSLTVEGSLTEDSLGGSTMLSWAF
jgi:hypothetical protein